MLHKRVHPVIVAVAFTFAISVEGYAFVRMTDKGPRITTASSRKLMEKYISDHEGKWYSKYSQMESERQWRQHVQGTKTRYTHQKAS